MALDAALESLGEIVLASVGGVEDAFQNVLDEVGGLKAPGAWVDTPEEDVQYLVNEYAPEVRGMRDALLELRGELDSSKVSEDFIDELDAWIADLNKDLWVLQRIKDNPDYATLEKVGGSRAFFNYGSEREEQIGIFIAKLQTEYNTSGIASL